LGYDYSIVVEKSDGSSVSLPVEFKRVWSAKSIRITPNLAKRAVLVSYPAYVTRARAAAFLESKRDWLGRQLGRAEEVRRIGDSFVISLFGKSLRISHLPSARRGVWAEDGRLFVSGEAAFLSRRVIDFVKAEALLYFKKTARLYAEALRVQIGRVSVKDTTSRWGSCTSEGNLSFSWRLAFAPLSVAEYIVAHEVAHRVEMNHSYRFWRLVRSVYDGNVDRCVKWLAREGQTLYSIE
jgi:predicted metal-dependent hydrolase